MIDWLIRCCEKEHEELCNDRYGHQEIVSDLKRDCRKKWDWLKSLKDRVHPQPKQEWSEEDEKQARQIERIVRDDGCTQKLQKQIADWLKSLLPQKQWKPNEEQLKQLSKYCIDNRILTELYEQLKAL